MEGNKIIEAFFEVNVALYTGESERRKELENCINFLLVNDFQKVIYILYRVDVNEARLKLLLHNNPSVDAAALITKMLVERQEEKQKSKGSFKAPPNIPEDEKW